MMHQRKEGKIAVKMQKTYFLFLLSFLSKLHFIGPKIEEISWFSLKIPNSAKMHHIALQSDIKKVLFLYVFYGKIKDQRGRRSLSRTRTGGSGGGDGVGTTSTSAAPSTGASAWLPWRQLRKIRHHLGDQVNLHRLTHIVNHCVSTYLVNNRKGSKSGPTLSQPTRALHWHGAARRK